MIVQIAAGSYVTRALPCIRLETAQANCLGVTAWSGIGPIDPRSRRLKTSDNVIGRFHQSVHHFHGSDVDNRLVLRYWPGASERVTKDGGFGGQRVS